MKKIVSILFFCFHIVQYVNSQNLVPNPSFEQYLLCPDNPGQIDKLQNWFIPLNHSGSPDYYNVCSTNYYSSIPSNINGFEFAATGYGYVGLGLSALNAAPNFREYLGVKLLSTLNFNNYYKVI
jgi:OmpA-OmpF porin, OOP family